MKALIQRVSEAEVEVASQSVGRIARGLLVLLGVEPGDGERESAFLARKIAALRIFEDEAGRMNRSLKDVGGAALVVSQFTLLADVARGNRPSFSGAAPPSAAIPLYERFCADLESQGVPVATGRFGAPMAVRLINDGPVTLWLDSRALLH
jgi:D-aminoacyl-tRNA deacylase